MRRLAEALGITTAAVYQWGDDVPEGRAWQLQAISLGKLRAEEREERRP